MKTRLALALLPLSWLACAPALARDTATERCEAAVTEAVVQLRGPQARDIQFRPSTRRLERTTADETAVRGEGSYRFGGTPSRPFSYSCAYNAASGSTSGVVWRETFVADAAAPAWQPDLTHLSPRACESAIAALLKARHPRVEGIVFDPTTRRLNPGEQRHTRLEGRGSLRRAAGMGAEAFDYECQLDPRDGQVVQARTSL